MRKITCQCCNTPHGAKWFVFKGLRICEGCRLAVIGYWRDVLGFTLADHPFLDEFMTVESRTTMKNPLDFFKRV